MDFSVPEVNYHAQLAVQWVLSSVDKDLIFTSRTEKGYSSSETEHYQHPENQPKISLGYQKTSTQIPRSHIFFPVF